MRTWFETCTPPLVIAEVAQNHDGSLGAAHAYIDAIAKTGADAVKFQTHIAAAESTREEPWRVKFSPQDECRYDYWKRMEFSEEQWRGLADHARARGLMFLSSAFSFEAVELLERIGVPAWKVGAGEIANLPLIDRMASGGRPVLLSSGMSRWEELDRAVETVRLRGAEVAVLQCTSAYPCPPEQAGFNVIAQIRERYGCPAGFSDHSGAIYAGLAAVALGARIIEVHTTFSRECFGPDVPASITTAELRQLVEGVRYIQNALAAPVDKDSMARQLEPMRALFGRSLVAAHDLPAGYKLAANDLTCKKPGTGMPASKLESVLNRKLKRPLAADAMLREDDLEIEEAPQD